MRSLHGKQVRRLGVVRVRVPDSPFWKDGRVAYYTGLLNRESERIRGFESRSFRFMGNTEFLKILKTFLLGTTNLA